MNLPQEVILHVIDKFLNVKDGINFATYNKTIWSIATFPRRKALILKNHSDVIQIRRVKEMIIENRYYHPDFIKHVLKYAINLNRIKFEKANYKIAFIQLFMVINQKCKLTVPATDLNLFQVVVKDNCNENIDIDTVNHGGKSVERMKTPEIVEKDVEEYKQNQKKKYFEQTEKGAIIMKDNLSNILLNHHNNQLFDTEQYSIYNNSHQTNVVLMTGCTDITEQQADELIKELCPRFIEFVVVLDGYWFFCTSFCTFIHSQSVDGCAYSSRVNAQNEAVSYIVKLGNIG